MLYKSTPFFIARRYFTEQRGNTFMSIFKTIFLLIIGLIPISIFSIFIFITGKGTKKYQEVINKIFGQNLIQMLSNISMIGVGVGAGALIIILSIFNGLEDLTRGLYSTYNPELKISATIGKSFEGDSILIEKIKNTEHITAVTKVIEDDAFLQYAGSSMRVVIKGVSSNYNEQYPLDKVLVSGENKIETENNVMRALIGIGVMHQLSISLQDQFKALVFNYPKKHIPVGLNPEGALNRKSVLPGGVLAIEQAFDSKYVIVPIEFTQDLLDYGNKITALEIKVDNPNNILDVQNQLKNLVGEDFKVLTADEQQASVLRAVKIERLFVFLGFIFILAVVSFNVFFSLAMLAIEKQKDIAIFFSMGAGKNFVRKIFFYEGCIIALTGATFGLLISFIIVFIQQEFGVIPLGVPSSIVDAYPVKIKAMDFLYTGLVVVSLTLVASYIPARNAAKTVIHEQV
ncbi:MAG: hypothetical protein CMO01_07690 [Thalassobius sp.]|nr:hypothetical protein [Thalassovita sp.]